MPSLFPPYHQVAPPTNVPGRTAGADGHLHAFASTLFAGVSTATVAVGDFFTVPGDVVEIAAFATIDLFFSCDAGTDLGLFQAIVKAEIDLFDNHAVTPRGRREIQLYNALAPVFWVQASGLQRVSLALDCLATRTATQANEQWTAGVLLSASAGGAGLGEAEANMFTTVTRIDYEFFWPA